MRPGDSIAAYSDAERVARFDAEMDLMHPNRAVMTRVILDVLAASGPPPSLVGDLGTGTGFLLEALLRRFPACRAVAVDGSDSMLTQARERLGDSVARVEFKTGDFAALDRLLPSLSGVDAFVSSFALHHLDPAGKAALLGTVRAALKPGGWILNADILIAEDPAMERLTQDMRARGIVERAAGRDSRFPNTAAVARFLADMETEEGDRPLTLSKDLQLLAEAGFAPVDVFWRETREAVTGGRR